MVIFAAFVGGFILGALVTLAAAWTAPEKPPGGCGCVRCSQARKRKA